MSKRLTEMADLVKPPSHGFRTVAGTAGAPAAATRDRTAPGQLTSFLRSQSDVFAQVESLRGKLAEFDDSVPAKYVDPKLVVASRWANRMEASFSTPEFLALKEEIKQAGGNIQPILVRPLPVTLNEETPQSYEIAFGHRRHRACLELGVDVLVLIEALTDSQLFENMERENRQRADLRPYEQGEMYRRAIDEQLYPSIRSMAEAIGLSHGNISAVIQIARLPQVVLDAFPSRLDIQHRWAPVLVEASTKHSDQLLEKATFIISERLAVSSKWTAPEVFYALSSVGQANKAAAQKPRVLEVEGRAVATIKSSGGRYSITFAKNAMTPEKVRSLEAQLQNLFK